MVVFSDVCTRTRSTAGPAVRRRGATAGLHCGYYYANTAKVTVVDVTDLATPQVTGEYYLPGCYDNSRRIGRRCGWCCSRLRSAGRRTCAGSPESSAPATCDEDKARLARRSTTLIAKNEKLIRAASAGRVAAHGAAHASPDGTLRRRRRYDCSDFHQGQRADAAGPGDGGDAEPGQPGRPARPHLIVAESGEIYASAEHLYVASRHWWWWPEPGQSDYTYLHKFDITEPDRARLRGLGRRRRPHRRPVLAWTRTQGLLPRRHHHHHRASRTPTNPHNWWGTLRDDQPGERAREKQRARSRSSGRREDLAKGERIFSSRFVGDKGYVVTFRQVDPLFTFDLSRPAATRRRSAS